MLYPYLLTEGLCFKLAKIMTIRHFLSIILLKKYVFVSKCKMFHISQKLKLWPVDIKHLKKKDEKLEQQSNFYSLFKPRIPDLKELFEDSKILGLKACPLWAKPSQ